MKDHAFLQPCGAVCTTCGYIRYVDIAHTFDDCEDSTCNDCGDVRVTGGHYYDSDSDPDCNGCGAIREVIPPVLPGDANGDGKMNNRDLGLLQQYLNEWDVPVNLTAADLNGDGKVNNRDLGQLQKFLND